jgi:hypothetical protein
VVHCSRIRIRTFDGRSPRLRRLIFSQNSDPVSVRLVRVRSSASRRPYRLLTHAFCVAVYHSNSPSQSSWAAETTARRISIYPFVLDFTSVSCSIHQFIR